MLSEREHERKAEILTHPQPAYVRDTSNAIVLKQGSLFLLSDNLGDVPWDLPHGLGLYDEDCRFLDGYTLRLNGVEPVALSSSSPRGFIARHDLTNPELADSVSGAPLPRNTLGIRRSRLVRGGVLHESLVCHNYHGAPARFRLEVRFRARFEDIFIVKGFVAEPRGELLPPRVEADRVTLRYAGKDGYWRQTVLAFRPAPSRLEGDRATYDLELAPGQEWCLAISITPSERPMERAPRRPGQPSAEPSDKARWLARAEAIWLSRTADVRSSHPLFDRVCRRALLDLRLLRSRLDGLHYFAAGVPWFATLFGRDAAIVGLQTLPYGLATVRETLLLLARYQATTADPFRDAEPGKILHEFRTGELAQLGAIPQSPAYYGTVDATPLFLVLLAEYVNWSGDLELARRLRPNLEAALDWIARFGDHDGDGYLDYGGRYPSGLVNQGWKDSGNAIVNADGTLADPPIALCEVQSYVYRAWRLSAGLLRALGEPERATALERRADELRERFERDFWSEELGCYVLALQRGGRPCAVATSNAGQVLWGGIARPDRAARVVERLMRPDLFSGWGIRTLSSAATAFNPISYHLGSVWPHDNALILRGFRRYGHDAAALRLFDALFEAASGFRDHRLPELFCGYPREADEERPVRYPVACVPQAWAAGAILDMLWALLGLGADALQGRLRIVRPRLPSWLTWLEVSDLWVGDARVDLRFERRADGSVAASSRVRTGALRIERDDGVAADAG